MGKLDRPLQLEPVFKAKIWGRQDLSPLYERTRIMVVPDASTSALTGNDWAVGEAWLTDDTSKFSQGPLSGMTLAEAVTRCGPELVGRNWPHPRFPLLAKHIFTSDWLSVQVHPDDNYARLHDSGSFGKCEMWYVVHADSTAGILLGLKPGVARETLRLAFEKGESKKLLNFFRTGVDEAIFLPPGTIHAMGPGLIMFEVEQNSDLTYRLDDFGRVGLDGKSRPLHLDKGLDVIRTALPLYRALPHFEFPEPFGSRRFVLANRYFALEELTVETPASFSGSPERVEVLTMLAGNGTLEAAGDRLLCQPGNTWIIPPATREYSCVPQGKTRWLKFYIPDLDEDFRQPLARRGLSSKEIDQIVFD
jgi:mannose-6-phosphate isomerase